MPNLQAAACDRIQEQVRVGLQVIISLCCLYIILTLAVCFRRLHSRQVVIQLGWDRGVNFVERSIVVYVMWS